MSRFPLSFLAYQLYQSPVEPPPPKSPPPPLKLLSLLELLDESLLLQLLELESVLTQVAALPLS